MEQKITWAKRVDPALIRKLYAGDAKHIQDDELADLVGYGLYARAESIIQVNRAHHDSIVSCPVCGGEARGETGSFACSCGWSMLKSDYHLTYKRKQLVAISIVPFAKKFISDWEKAKDSYPEKMKAIDYLLHCFHYELEDDRNCARPAVINFIECNTLSGVELLFELAFGCGSAEYGEQMKRWLDNARTSHLYDFIISKEDELKKRIS